MMMAIATLCLAVALVLTGSRRFVGAIDIRFARLVPARVAVTDVFDADQRYQRIVRRALVLVDPSFARTEEGLRSLGVSRLPWIIGIEVGKLTGAVAAATLVATFAGAIIGKVFTMVASPLALLLFIVLVDRFIRNAALKRR